MDACICASFSHTQSTCSLFKAFKWGKLPLPTFFFTPSPFTTITSPFCPHAYTFLLFIVSMVHPRPSPISFSGWPIVEAYIFPSLRQTVSGVPSVFIASPPPSIGQPVSFQVPSPNFCACPKDLPPSDDFIKYKSLLPFSQLRNIT